MTPEEEYVLRHFPRDVGCVILQASVAAAVPPSDEAAAGSSEGVIHEVGLWYECTARLNTRNREEFEQWLQVHQQITGTKYRLLRTKSRTGTVVIYKADYRCQHNTRPSSHRVKKPTKQHTECPAMISVTVKAVNSRCRSTDVYLLEFPTSVRISNKHNHPLYPQIPDPQLLGEPDEELTAKFLQLFKLGHTPMQALEAHKMDLLENDEENFFVVCFDGSVCPSTSWVHNLYYSLYCKVHGGPSMVRMATIADLEPKVEQMTPGQAVMIEMGGEVAIVLCTELMEHVHRIPASGETCYLDGLGNVDRYNCRVYLLLVDTEVGGLPAGAILTTSEDDKLLTVALQELWRILPETAFGGRSYAGPKTLVTDGSTAKWPGLRVAFPQTTIMVGVYHVLQAAWRWVWDASHGFEPEHCQQCYCLIANMLYSHTEEEFDSACREIEHFEALMILPSFQEFFIELYGQRDSWALAFRLELGNATSVTESAFRVLREKVFVGTRAYGIRQLYHFMTETLVEQYKRKIMDIGSGRAQYVWQPRFFQSKSKVVNLMVTSISGNVYSVFSPDTATTYVTEVEIGLCSCPLGMAGGACRHQQAVCVATNSEGCLSLPLSPESKRLYHWVATGSSEIPEDWNTSLDFQGSGDPLPDRKNGISSKLLDEPNGGGGGSIITLEEPPECDKDRCQKKLGEVIDIAMRFYDADPRSFESAVAELHRTCSSLNTASRMMRALRGFGKQPPDIRRPARKGRPPKGLLPPPPSSNEHSYGRQHQSQKENVTE